MDEVIKVQIDEKLNFNLGKSSIKNILYSLNKRKLCEMRTEVAMLHTHAYPARWGCHPEAQKECIEGAGFEALEEPYKLYNIKYFSESVFACLTTALGLYWLWI